MTEKVGTLKIDASGLEAMAAKSRERGVSPRTLKAKTYCESGFRNFTYVRDLDPVLVSEPPQLLGDDAAPNPSEMALAALGSCISVGLLANATSRGVELEEISLELEGDIDTSAVWGVGDTPEDKVAGFTAVRVKVSMKSDAPEEELDAIQKQALRWSPVGNTFQNPVELTSELVTR